MRRRKIKRDDDNPLREDRAFQGFPILGIKAANAVNLFDQQDVAFLRHIQQPEEFRPLERRAAFILNEPAAHPLACLFDKLGNGFLGAACILFVCAGSEVRVDSHMVQYR